MPWLVSTKAAHWTTSRPWSYVLCTLFPPPGYLDDQCSEFLESWMASIEFEEFPKLIKYYTTIGNGPVLKEEYTTMEICTLLKDVKYFMYLTRPYFSEDTPNQILHILSTLLLWLKMLYATIGQYPTLYNFLAIAPKEISHWNYYPTYPNKCAKLRNF